MPLRLCKFPVLALLLVGAGYGVLALQAKSTPAQAAPEGATTPGQLTLLDKSGKPTGVCPLKHTDVQADLAGYVARVTVKQEFVNPASTPVEALYTFPLPEDAAVDTMDMTLGNRLVRGQIKRREEAREIYEAAKSQGKSAALLDQERPNIFTQSVANLMPGEKVVITLSYVHLLKYEEGVYTFVFPMVVGPRFIQNSLTKFEGDPGTTPITTDASKITPPIPPKGTRAGHDISLSVNLEAGLPLQGVRSGGHEISLQKRGRTGALVRLRNQSEIPNKDFLLRYTAAGSQMEEGLLCYAPGPGDKGGYFTLILQPPLAPPQEQVSRKEMVFVIDQTGSQSGWPIAKAKETMKYCLANMNPGDTFQLIGFNTAIFPCFPAPVPNTPENVAKALAFLAPIEGNGGTDILKSVDYALTLPDDPARLRIVCYMTDGYVGNDMQIIEHIKKNRGRARMFPFGVGNSVNRFLIEGMAKEGRGAAEYVAVNTNGGAQYGGPAPASEVKGAKEVAERFYHRIASPLLLDPQVDWGSLPVADVYPKVIPDVFSAGPIILKGRYTKAGEGVITVRGRVRGQPWERKIPVSFPARQVEGSALATLWAREKIEDLQGQDWLGAQANNPNKGITEQIIALALEYKLMSQWTSFVAVEERVVNVGGKQRTLAVPVEMPEGVSYEGIFGDEKASEDKSMAGRFGRGGFGGGYGYARGMIRRSGGVAGPQSPASLGAIANPSGGTIPVQPPTSGKPVASLAKKEALAEAEKENAPVRDLDDLSAILDGKEAAQKRLTALKPEERRTLLRQVKLAAGLQKQVGEWEKSKKPGTKVEVQVWLNSLPPDGSAKLKALGFHLLVTLTPNKLLLGEITLDKLDALIALGFVRKVEPPKFK